MSASCIRWTVAAAVVLDFFRVYLPTVTTSITDRSEMTIPVLLGRDVLEAYTLDISRTVEE